MIVRMARVEAAFQELRGTLVLAICNFLHTGFEVLWMFPERPVDTDFAWQVTTFQHGTESAWLVVTDFWKVDPAQ